MSSRSLWSVIVEEAFNGNKAIMRGRPNCIQGDGSPDGVVTGKVGLLYWDYTNSIAYICEDASTNWLPISV